MKMFLSVVSLISSVISNFSLLFLEPFIENAVRFKAGNLNKNIKIKPNTPMHVFLDVDDVSLRKEVN